MRGLPDFTSFLRTSSIIVSIPSYFSRSGVVSLKFRLDILPTFLTVVGWDASNSESLSDSS
jgi:hypothetical protein